MDDAAFAAARPGYVAAGLAARPGTAPVVLGREYDAIKDARATLANLSRLASLCGAGRVTYLPCDITDLRLLSEGAAVIAGLVPRIDLLINAAGLNRSAPIAAKTITEFRRIRDLKVRGYQNLVQAFAGRRPARWYNFGSLLGVTGQVGEADYASANDFLGLAAVHASAAGAVERTIGWTLWGEVGLGTNPLTKAYFEK
ncbi:MAG: SDR family NAD(P)-dependent oxidoreductase, partial [Frankiaceae bacterium]|nr:SDR family NAD(P)-dependent oxidoreductase [Frankiaceae bacterium]